MKISTAEIFMIPLSFKLVGIHRKFWVIDSFTDENAMTLSAREAYVVMIKVYCICKKVNVTLRVDTPIICMSRLPEILFGNRKQDKK